MRITLVLFSIVVPALATVAACSSSSDAPADAPPSGETALAAPPAGQGLQFRMTTTLAPSFETERCQMFQVGPDGLAFDHSEVRYTPGSHHVLLYETAYTSFPTKDENGVAVDAAAVHDCAATGMPADEEAGEDEVGVFVILKEGQKATAVEIDQWVDGKLPEFIRPRFIQFVDSFPMTPSGKIQKAKLRAMGIRGMWDRLAAAKGRKA